jgi:exosortase
VGGAELAVAIALGLAFAPGLASLARVWASTDYLSHGFLVPLVSAWIAWATRTRRAALPRKRDARGAALIALALALYAASLLASSPSGEGLALVAALAGAVWFLRGASWLRALAFPIGFLAFAVPIPPDWLTPVIVRLLLFVSSASVAILQTLGVAVARDGNVIGLPSGESLFVAEACSGLTSILTLAPIATLVAYLSPLPPARKLALVALVVPIAMAANLLRVVGTVLGARVWGVGFVTGDPVHVLLGLAVYASACLALLAAARALGGSREATAGDARASRG